MLFRLLGGERIGVAALSELAGIAPDSFAELGRATDGGLGAHHKRPGRS